jgi:proteasome lid subunit RPN8/RPN11
MSPPRVAEERKVPRFTSEESSAGLAPGSIQRGTVSLSSELLQRLREHARSSYPEECCGALLGQADPSSRGEKRVLEVLAVPNERADSRRNRFLISADEIRRLEGEARRRGLDILGFYHSHPDHPARPSEFDREHAWPWYSYIILEVPSGGDGAVQAWRLSEDRERFEPEILEERR